VIHDVEAEPTERFFLMIIVMMIRASVYLKLPSTVLLSLHGTLNEQHEGTDQTMKLRYHN
jgi:hypothetical protein